MEKLTSKEFFEQLKANTLKPDFKLKGLVKKSDKDSEVLFARKGSVEKWIGIPSSMIESAIVLKSFKKEEDTIILAKLQLKKPTTPEGQLFYDLLFSLETEARSGGNCGCHSHQCSCGCHAHQCNCGCQSHHCSCGCRSPHDGCHSH